MDNRGHDPPLSEKPELFKGRHFNHLLIIQAARWYVTYKLSYRDVCDLMAERGVTVVHTTVLRWVQCFVPAFEKKWKNYARPVGSSWRVDETYIKVKGQWRYLYRAVDKQGQTVDFLLTRNRDQAAAVRFFKKAIGNNEAPEKITLDGSRASHQAVAELKAEGALPAQTLVRTSKYLNNMIEQDHRKVKQRCYPMLGFKTFGNAEVTLSGIELANKIKKGQFNTSEITGPWAMILQVWEAVLPRRQKLKIGSVCLPSKNCTRTGFGEGQQDREGWPIARQALSSPQSVPT